MNLMQQRIQAAVARAARGQLDLPPGDNWCLSAVRRVLEDAFGWKDGEFYQRLCTTRAPVGRAGRDPWAVDFEVSMRERGFTVPLEANLQAGDILFSALPQPFGHVAQIYLNKQDGKLWVFENSTVRRRGGVIIDGPNQLVPLENWREKVTTVGRLPDNYPDVTVGTAPPKIVVEAGQSTPEHDLIIPLFGVPGYDQARIMKLTSGKGFKAYGLRSDV